MSGDRSPTVTTMETALEQAHRSKEWKEFVERNIFQDIFLGSAGFAKFLAQRLEETRPFYDDVGLGRKP